MNIPVILLAAGLSSRMGAFKPLLEVGGASALAKSIRLFRSLGLPVLTVTGHRAAELSPLIAAEAPAGTKIGPVTGIAGRKGFDTVLVEKSMMNSEVGFAARLLDIFAAHGVPFEHCPTGIDTMSVVVSADAFRPHREEILAALEALKPDNLKVEEGLAMIAVVGCGMVANKGIAARILGAVTAAGVNIRMIDQGSSELNIIIGVREEDYETAIRGLYKEFH